MSVPRIPSAGDAAAALPAAAASASPQALALLGSTDWSATPLGPRAQWPRSLQMAVSICLCSRFPMFVWWGPDLINLHNDAYIPLLGKRHPQAFGQAAPRVWAEIWNVVGPEAEQVMRQGDSTWNERVRLAVERNGFVEDAWFTWSYSPLPDGTAQGVGGLLCVCTEDTARVVAERDRDALLLAASGDLARLAREEIDKARASRRLSDSEQRFRIAALLAHSVVWTNDAEGRMTGEQPGWQAFTGQEPSAFLGYGWADAVHPEDGSATVAAWQAAVSSRSEFVHRHRVRRADGQWRICDIHALPLLDPQGTVREWVGVHTDITERLALDAQLQQSLVAEQAARGEAERASRMKDEFLATLSHELRTPLSAILGWVTLLRRRGSLPEEVERGVTVIERNARAQSQIIADLLDMSAIVSGKVHLEMNTVDLQAFVALAVDTARPQAAAKGLSIECHLEAGRRLDVLGDANRLQQIPWNLLSNAIKFTPTGGRIDVRLAVQGQQVVLEVRDNGEGIAPDFMPFLFDRFRQADASITRRQGGLGLGLSIVKKLAELHHGTVSADSAGPGCGATFSVRLPLAPGWELPSDFGQPLPEVAPPRHVDRSAPLDARLRGLRVLLVDDDADGRETTQRLLEHRGVHVTPAGSAAEALSALDRAAFDVVVSDIGMPLVDGYGLMRQVREREAHRPGPPLAAIALTAYARPEDMSKAVAAGFDLHVAKPADPLRLSARPWRALRP